MFDSQQTLSPPTPLPLQGMDEEQKLVDEKAEKDRASRARQRQRDRARQRAAAPRNVRLRLLADAEARQIHAEADEEDDADVEAMLQVLPDGDASPQPGDGLEHDCCLSDDGAGSVSVEFEEESQLELPAAELLSEEMLEAFEASKQDSVKRARQPSSSSRQARPAAQAEAPVAPAAAVEPPPAASPTARRTVTGRTRTGTEIRFDLGVHGRIMY